MNFFVILFITLWGITLSLSAQSTNIHQFLLPEYQDALILYKDGRQFQAPVNFNLLEGQFLFIDSKDKESKRFSNPELISLIRIGERCFLLGDKETTEVIQSDPMFRVSYSGNLRKAPKNLTYGGTTQTASVDSYSGMMGSGLISGRPTNNQVVTGINKTYEVKIGKKTKRFFSKNSFLKAVPKLQRPEMEAHLEQHEVDFDNVQQVLELYKQLIELTTK